MLRQQQGLEAIHEGWKRVECLVGAVENGGDAVQGSGQKLGCIIKIWTKCGGVE